MRFHASCAAYLGPDGYDSVLLLGASGSGKSDLLLRLLHEGWLMVADDQVIVEDGIARAPEALAGVMEVRGLGLFKQPYLAQAPLRLVVQLGVQTIRLPEPQTHDVLNLPMVTLDPDQHSAPARLALALAAACGRAAQIAGAFAV
ncbi:MAG TPA: aldolase [Acidocella sp.]|nr:aldolase [Acidocella sp.]